MPHPHPHPPRRGRDQEGMALVIALLILLVLSMLGAGLMVTVGTESRIAGHQLRNTQALAIAEAGVQEAIMRIRTGDVPDNLNKRSVAIIYEAPAGSLPVSGTDTTSLPTLQPAGSYLGYSSATKQVATGSLADLRALVVRYKTVTTTGASPDTQIVRYDDSANPKFNTTTGTPVFQIISSGGKGSALRGVVAEVTRSKFNILAKGAVTAQVAIQFRGNIKVCGHDHRADTPVWTEPPVCNLPYGSGGWLGPDAHGSCMPGGWSEQEITQQGSPAVYGEPAAEDENNGTGFYSGPWDVLGLSQTDFWSWVGPPLDAVPGGVPQGIFYLDEDTTPQNPDGRSWTFNGGDGEGFLYCDGDLRINGNFTYRGLIYCEGDLDINGNCWILGAIVVHGKTIVKVANGSAVVLYSAEAIQQFVAKYGGNLRMLSWREF
jgi:Tfp pilus assembly protein PilX